MDVLLTGLEIPEPFCVAWSPNCKPWHTESLSAPEPHWQAQVGRRDSMQGQFPEPQGVSQSTAVHGSSALLDLS